MAASPLYSGALAKVWSCLAVTTRGYGNKDLFTGPAQEQNQCPFTAPVLTLRLLDVSHVHVMHKKQGSKYTVCAIGKQTYVRLNLLV